MTLLRKIYLSGVVVTYGTLHPGFTIKRQTPSNSAIVRKENNLYLTKALIVTPIVSLFWPIVLLPIVYMTVSVMSGIVHKGITIHVETDKVTNSTTTTIISKPPS